MNSNRHHKTYFIAMLFLFVAFSVHALSPDESEKIGRLIWQNEASQKKELLVYWSPHEQFPSLGIGHFIWYPEDTTPQCTQQFPDLCNYLQQHGISLPEWLKQALSRGAPWKTRTDFMADTKRRTELEQLLYTTISVQIDFIIERFEQKWPFIEQAAPEDKQLKIRCIYELMKSSPIGTYALIDYSNFKGHGLNPQERIYDQGWGLLQVLLDMPDDLCIENATKVFSLSAAQILIQLIKNDSPEYNRIRHLAGWINRLSTYYDQSHFDKI